MSSIWQECLSHLQDKVTSTNFTTWLSPLEADIHDTSITIYAMNQFVAQWVQDKYLTEIRETLQLLTNKDDFSIKVVVGDKPKAPLVNTQTSRQKTNTPSLSRKKEQYPSALNPKYTFDTYVAGKSNQLARAVAENISINPGEKSSNPLFLYGSTGLGKTHLIHAIGHAILANNPNATIIYMHAERYVNEYIKAIQTNNMEKFKKKYRTVDALLIDDIQFFAGKGGSQEEFFHTFNALFELEHQIILTSDRYPKEIDKLEERLKSRLGWGLSIPIEPPELEMRVAILIQKAQENRIPLSEECAFFIAQKVKTNVRELEGALNQVNANANFTGKTITIDFIRESLKDLLALQDKLITIENIQKTVAEYYKIKISDLKSKSRKRSITRPRQLAMSLAKELTSHSLPEIGKAFGDRDHTTVLHACRAIEKLRKSDLNIEEDYSNLNRTLSA